MAQPYVGEIRMFGGNFAPAGWMFCEGQQLPIAEFDTLFELIGTIYGGDGQSNFNLPNLGGRLPVHQGLGMQVGSQGGVEQVTLSMPQVPVHTHVPVASLSLGTSNQVQNNVPASYTGAGTDAAYGNLNPFRAIDASSIGPAGGSQPHNNLHPYLCISFIISLYGIFPSPT